MSPLPVSNEIVPPPRDAALAAPPHEPAPAVPAVGLADAQAPPCPVRPGDPLPKVSFARHAAWIRRLSSSTLESSSAPPSAETAASPSVIRGIAVWKWYYAFLRDQVGALASFNKHYGRLGVLCEPFSRRGKCFIASGAEYNRQVLGDPQTFHAGGLILRGPSGSVLNRLRRGLIGANGPEHREIRRVVAPLFLPKAVQQYVPRMANVIARELDAWPVGSTLDVSEQISHLSLLVSAENLLGGENPEETLELSRMTADVLRQSYALSVRLLRLNAAGTPFQRLIKKAEQLERMLLELIDRREPQSHESTHLLDRLISFHRAEPDRLKREDLVGQMFILFAASHETVAKAVTWTLFLLSQHPRVMADVHTELESRCAGAPPTMDDLDELKLLDAVTKETMRLIPPVPWTRRSVQAEGQLGGLPVQRKDFVFLDHFTTHRDPEVFSDPNRFLPQRWFGSQPDSYEYLPFSAGPRTCIGKVLGTATINLMVAMILQRLRLTMVPGSRVDRSYQVTLAPKFGMPMCVEHHDGRFQAVPVTGNVHQMVDLTAAD